jgi:iron(III) transport system substrate-binding protein
MMTFFVSKALFALGIWLFHASMPLSAADIGSIALYRGSDRQAKLEKAAHAEGSVVWYTSIASGESSRYVDLFEKRYPHIKVSLVRSNSSRMAQRYTAEYLAGTFLADVLDTGDTTIEFFRRKGMLQAYYSPLAEKFDKRFIQNQNFWVANRSTMTVLGYNTRLVKAAEVPTRYEEVLEAKWKDKISLERDDSQWFMALMEYWGEQKGKAFFQKLRAQNPRIRTGHTLQAQLIAAGEDALSPDTHSGGIASAQRAGAPVEWGNLEPVVVANNVAALAKNAPHPNAAMLFLDFMLSKDGAQKVLREVNRIPTHPEVPPNPPRLRDGFNFIVIDPAKYNDDAARYGKLWREWVLQE